MNVAFLAQAAFIGFVVWIYKDLKRFRSQGNALNPGQIAFLSWLGFEAAVFSLGFVLLFSSDFFPLIGSGLLSAVVAALCAVIYIFFVRTKYDRSSAESSPMTTKRATWVFWALIAWLGMPILMIIGIYILLLIFWR